MCNTLCNPDHILTAGVTVQNMHAYKLLHACMLQFPHACVHTGIYII